MRIDKILFTCSTLLLSATLYAQSQDFPNDRFKQEFLNRINKVRIVGCSCGRKYYPAVEPIKWNSTLESSAGSHAKDMNDQNYFSHISKDGRNMEDRITTAGYVFKGYKSFAIGENIAYSQQSIAEVQDGWFKSEGHCKNLMNPAFKEIGVARNGLYWVQDFGGRESFSPEQQKMINDGNGKLTIKRVKVTD